MSFSKMYLDAIEGRKAATHAAVSPRAKAEAATSGHDPLRVLDALLAAWDAPLHETASDRSERTPLKF